MTLTKEEKHELCKKLHLEFDKLAQPLKDNDMNYMIFVGDNSNIGGALFGWGCLGCSIEHFLGYLAYKFPMMNWTHDEKVEHKFVHEEPERKM